MIFTGASRKNSSDGKAVAEAAAKAPGDWERAAWSAADVMDGEYEVGELIILHDPADALRRYERDLNLLDLYAESLADEKQIGRMTGAEIHEHYARLELLRSLVGDLAASLGIPVGGEDE